MIILSTHYGKLLSITTVSSRQEHIGIDIRYSEPLQGPQVLYPGLWFLSLGSWVSNPGVLDLGPGVLGAGSCNMAHKLLRPSPFLEIFMEILEWSTLQKQIRSLPPTQCCSILTGKKNQSLCQETVSDTCKQHW